MKIEQIYTGCLAHGAYYIVSGKEAAIIDPLRETKPYLERLAKDEVTLKYIFETHFHADFVSGHLDLAEKTGAEIVYGPTAKPNFKAITAEDQQIFKIGDVQIKVLHTPGHTLESATFLLIDESGKEHAIFSGDTLFLGDVGRPDLAQKAANMTQEELAGLLYDSLQNKIMPLADDIIVYPGHGAGSACGKNMQKETVDLLGNQKKTNYALNHTRPAAEFHKGFIPNSINIGLKGDFAPWAGAMIVDVKQPILLVTEQDTEEEVITRLSRVGFDHVLGYLEGGFTSWKQSGKEIDSVHRITATELAEKFTPETKVVDVRKEGEFNAGHIENALHLPLAQIADWASTLNNDEFFVLHCAGGYRSMIAASILNARGIRNFSEIEGGFNKIKETNLPQTKGMCSLNPA